MRESKRLGGEVERRGGGLLYLRVGTKEESGKGRNMFGDKIWMCLSSSTAAL